MLTTFIGVLSLGYIFVPMLGSFHTDFLKRQRLGKFFYGYDYHEHALIIFMTTLVTLFTAIMFRALSLYVDWFVLDKVVYFLVVLSLAQIMPVPWLEGLQVFFGNRFLYSFLRHVYCACIRVTFYTINNNDGVSAHYHNVRGSHLNIMELKFDENWLEYAIITNFHVDYIIFAHCRLFS